MFFNEGLTATGPTNNIMDTNTNVIFSAGKFGAAAILLDGGVTIGADPPSSAPTMAVTISDSHDRVQHEFGQFAVVSPAISQSFNQLNLDEAQTFVDVASASNNTRSAVLPIEMIKVQPAIIYSRNNDDADDGSGYQHGWISDTELANGAIPAASTPNTNNSDKAMQAVPNRGSILLTPSQDTSLKTAFGTKS